MEEVAGHEMLTSLSNDGVEALDCVNEWKHRRAPDLRWGPPPNQAWRSLFLQGVNLG